MQNCMSEVRWSKGTTSTSTVTGSVIVAGGIGVENIYAGGLLSSGTGAYISSDSSSSPSLVVHATESTFTGMHFNKSRALQILDINF